MPRVETLHFPLAVLALLSLSLSFPFADAAPVCVGDACVDVALCGVGAGPGGAFVCVAHVVSVDPGANVVLAGVTQATVSLGGTGVATDDCLGTPPLGDSCAPLCDGAVPPGAAAVCFGASAAPCGLVFGDDLVCLDVRAYAIPEYVNVTAHARPPPTLPLVVVCVTYPSPACVALPDDLLP